MIPVEGRYGLFKLCTDLILVSELLYCSVTDMHFISFRGTFDAGCLCLVQNFIGDCKVFLFSRYSSVWFVIYFLTTDYLSSNKELRVRFARRFVVNIYYLGRILSVVFRCS